MLQGQPADIIYTVWPLALMMMLISILLTIRLIKYFNKGYVIKKILELVATARLIPVQLKRDYKLSIKRMVRGFGMLITKHRINKYRIILYSVYIFNYNINR